MTDRTLYAAIWKRLNSRTGEVEAGVLAISDNPAYLRSQCEERNRLNYPAWVPKEDKVDPMWLGDRKGNRHMAGVDGYTFSVMRAEVWDS